jgi:hypothetical protein
MRFLVIFFFFFVIQLQPKACPDDLARFLNSTNSIRKRTRISQIEIPSDGVFGSGTFIVPNELGGWRFHKASKKNDDALISVGTFRSLNSYAFGDYKRLVMLDFDGVTQKFNQANLDSIENLSRWDYVRSLFGFDKHIEPPEGWGDPNKEIEFLIREYTPDQELSREFHIQFELGKQFVNHEFNLTLGEFRRKMTEVWGWGPRVWSNTILGNEKKYLKLQRKIKQGQILVVHGDLSGESSMLEVARSLENLSIKVAAIDISNAIHYIERQYLFIKNIRRLPLQENARVMLSTLGGYEAKPYKDMWMFWSVPALDFLSQYESHLAKIHMEHPVAKALKRTLSLYEKTPSNLSLEWGDEDLTLSR